MERPTYWERLTVDDVRDLFDAIEYGDDEHRAWLFEALTEWANRRPVPPPRGIGKVVK